MYKVEYLPSADRDLVNAIRYIAYELKNPTAAERFGSGMVAAIESLATMPYRKRVYQPIRPLKHEYRFISHANYHAFYWIEEERQAVVVARILYARSDISTRLSAAEN